MTIFEDLIKAAVQEHFCTKICISINKEGYKETLGVTQNNKCNLKMLEYWFSIIIFKKWLSKTQFMLTNKKCLIYN
jgi:transcription elongation factor GreA-like protein